MLKNIPVGLLTLTLALAACSSEKKKKEEWVPPKQVDQTHVDWDYNKVREARAAEKAATPAEAAPGEEESKCTVLSHEQMTRAKAVGCRKMNPREGHGEDSYCCPQ